MESVTNDYINLRDPCDTMRVGEQINERGYGIATSLQSPLSYYLNLAILQLQETGEIDRIYNKWWLDGATCPTAGADKVKVIEQQKMKWLVLTINNNLSLSCVKQSNESIVDGQLSTESICGLFVLLVALMAVGILVAIVEVVVKSRSDASRDNVRSLEAATAN